MTNSFCGSPEYMAPEVVLKQGHSYAVDYYTLGALLHELVCGLPPFYSRNHQQMLSRICYEELVIPDTASDILKDLLTKLLDKDKKARVQNFQEIKSHPWMHDIVWDKLISKKMRSPLNIDIYKSNIHAEFLDIELNFQDFDEEPMPENSFFDYLDENLGPQIPLITKFV